MSDTKLMGPISAKIELKKKIKAVVLRINIQMNVISRGESKSSKPYKNGKKPKTQTSK